MSRSSLPSLRASCPSTRLRMRRGGVARPEVQLEGEQLVWTSGGAVVGKGVRLEDSRMLANVERAQRAAQRRQRQQQQRYALSATTFYTLEEEKQRPPTPFVGGRDDVRVPRGAPLLSSICSRFVRQTVSLSCCDASRMSILSLSLFSSLMQLRRAT